MMLEMEAIIKNKTWEDVYVLPEDRKPVGYVWVINRKFTRILFVTKHGYEHRDFHKRKDLIILIPIPLLSSKFLLQLLYQSLLLNTCIYIRWMLIQHFSMVR